MMNLAGGVFRLVELKYWFILSLAYLSHHGNSCFRMSLLHTRINVLLCLAVCQRMCDLQEF